MAIERRRSDRLMLTIPLLVRGVDENGEAFECEAYTININRHGARIRMARILHGGQQVKVLNKLSRKEAVFRVAGPLTPLTERGGEFGFMGPIALDTSGSTEPGKESLDSTSSLWGIRFPSLPGGEDSCAKALLACRECRQPEMARLTMVDIEVLDSSGILARHCAVCQCTTPWGHAESATKETSPAAESSVAEGASGRERRRSRRLLLQMPTLVRDYFGGIEITTSENVSKGGVCFASEKIYQIGEGIMVACPYDKAGQSIEVEAVIVSRRNIDGTHRRVYGVRYRREPSSRA